MQVSLSADGLDQFDERCAARKRRDAENGKPRRQVQSEPACTQVVEQTGQSLGWAGHSDAGTHQAPQVGLPAVVFGKRATGAVDVVARAPVQHELGPAHGIAVEEIGEASGPPEPGCTGGQDRERAEAVVAAFGTQHLEHRPDETVDLPRIGNPVAATSLEHRLAQRAGEGEPDVRGDTVAKAGPGRAE